MSAYEPGQINSIFVQDEAALALQEKAITADEFAAIKTAYPVHLYQPNYFVRLGLILLTIIVIVFSFGVCALVLLSTLDKSIGGLLIFFGIACYAALEWLIKEKRHYGSGVDDALLLGSVISLLCGIGYSMGILDYPGELGILTGWILCFITSSLFSFRFADRLMAAAAYISALAICFYACLVSTQNGFVLIPFVSMCISLLVFLFAHKRNEHHPFSEHRNSYALLKILSLIGFYASCNYWVVQELGGEMINGLYNQEKEIPAAGFFWTATFLVPLVYLFIGIRNKDRLFLYTGSLLIAAMCITLRYYHPFAPVATCVMVGGAVMIIIAWWLTKYLAQEKNGFVSFETLADETENAEAIAIAQTFTPAQTEQRFGGGSFGGGGASGGF